MGGALEPLIWLLIGMLLIGSEVFVPGLVMLFPGLGALVVAALQAAGWVESLPASLVTWAASSIALFAVMRRTLRRWFPAEESRRLEREGADAYGKLVDVLEDVAEQSPGEALRGRIRHEGTTWPAASTSGTIRKGERARLVYREELAWVVEPAPALPLPPSDPAGVPENNER
ncbi:MAG: NfeD family protein [Myxococcota bacterium]